MSRESLKKRQQATVVWLIYSLLPIAYCLLPNLCLDILDIQLHRALASVLVQLD